MLFYFFALQSEEGWPPPPNRAIQGYEEVGALTVVQRVKTVKGGQTEGILPSGVYQPVWVFTSSAQGARAWLI